MKFLTDAQYQAISSRAQRFDEIFNSLKEANPELKEDASSEDIINMIMQSNTTDNTSLQHEVDTLTQENATLSQKVNMLETENTALQERVANLMKTPGEPSAAVTSQKEINASEGDAVLNYANENPTDTIGILTQYKKTKAQ